MKPSGIRELPQVFYVGFFLFMAGLSFMAVGLARDEHLKGNEIQSWGCQIIATMLIFTLFSFYIRME